MIPDTATDDFTPSFSFHAWRENFLHLILRGALVFGLGALIPTLLTNQDPAFLTIYSVAYIVLLIIAFVPVPYLFRAWTFITLFYLIGASGLLDTGIWGDSRVFFVSMVVVTAMLVSPRAAVGATILTLFSTGIAGWFILSGRYELSNSEVGPGHLANWVSVAAAMLMLDAVMIAGLSLLQKEFIRAQDRASRSVKDLEVEREQLEERVVARTRESLYKTNQLEAASRVARKITEIRDLQMLLNDIVRTIAEQFNLYHVGIFLLDANGEYAVLQAASSEGGRRMLEAGFRLRVGAHGIVGFVTDQARPHIASDVKSDSTFIQYSFLPSTRSEMALPLIARERVIGALDIQSDIQHAFSDADLEIMQTLADQLATAIENARLFGNSEAIIGQFEALTALQTPRTWNSFLKGRKPAYQYTPTGIRPVSASTLNGNAKSLRVPLVLRGQEIGVINLRRKETSSDWSLREQELAREISAQIALALENARLFEETARRAEVERATSEISTRISSSTLYESIIQTAAEELSRALGGSEVLVQIQPSQPKNEVGARQAEHKAAE
jgi:GAF domain-containing protein